MIALRAPERLQNRPASDLVLSRAGHGRVFELGDYVGVVALVSERLCDLYPAGREWLKTRLRDVAAGSAAAYVVGRTTLHGVAILTPKGEGRMKLSTIYVAPQSRSQGVGTELMSCALRHAGRHGVNELWVTVAHHVSHELTPLLSSSGFARTAIEPDRYGPGRHEEIFVRLS